MKVKKYENLFIVIIILLIGFFLGFSIHSLLFKPSKEINDDKSQSEKNDYISTIKESENKSEKAEEILTRLEELESKLVEIESEKIEISSQIILLKNELNSVTDFEFENEIYPDINDSDAEEKLQENSSNEENDIENFSENTENFESFESQENQ